MEHQIPDTEPGAPDEGPQQQRELTRSEGCEPAAVAGPSSLSLSGPWLPGSHR